MTIKNNYTMKNIFEKLEDLWWYLTHGIKDAYWNTKWYFRNRITFNKVLKEWRPWDSEYQVNLFKFGIEQLCECVNNGYEETVSKNKKVAAMKQLVAELSRDIEDETHIKVFGKNYDYGFYTDENGVLHSNRDANETKNLYKKYEETLRKERNKHYDTIFRLIKGQTDKELTKLQDENLQKLTPEEQKEAEKEGYYHVWVQGFDGTGIEGWWE